MLCRALIVALVLTCTLPHARGQAAQHLDRIKDLMCVLLLSGIQKEDLDVGMLTKLQRHNVNIDGMNNEELLQECIHLQDNSTNDKAKNLTDNHNIKNKHISEELKTNADLEMLQRRRNAENFLNDTKLKINKFNEYNNKRSNENTGEDKLISDKVTTNFSNQTLENALKFFQNARESDQSGLENKRSVIYNLQSSESDTLNKLIANFISKKNNIIIKPTTTEKTSYINNLYEQILAFRTPDFDKIPNLRSGIQQSMTFLPSMNQKEIGDQPIINVKNPNFTNVQTLLKTYSQLNPFLPDGEISDLNAEVNDNFKLYRNPYKGNLKKTDVVDALGTNVGAKHTLSRDMIKEIADTVKDLILRDLRKELHETTKLTTTTTIITTTTTQTTAKTDSTINIPQNGKENSKTQDSIMNKFLELFEEIKSLKHNTIFMPNGKENGIDNKDTRQNVDIKEFKLLPKITSPPRIANNPIKSNYNPPIYVNQVANIKQYPTVNSENSFSFAPQIHKYRLDGTFKKQETKELNKVLLPITVQTNNIEVPPLSLPLDSSQNLIRQNIIITTGTPYKIVPIINGPLKNKNQDRSPYLEPKSHLEHLGSKPLKMFKSRQFHPNLPKLPYKPPENQFHLKSNDDVIRFTLNNNDHSRYNADYYEKINIGKHKPRPHTETINHELPRFHEKLEKVERYLDYPEQGEYTDFDDCCNEKFKYSPVMVDCCNKKIASRHQKSLSNMKNKSYDDTDIHFKNFLQSQQKVTDMLEKILGDKRNVQSVETA